MSEYIVDVGDADELHFTTFQKRAEFCFGYPVREEIVRCRKCMYYEEYDGEYWCTQHDIMTLKDMSDGFCKWGERRTRMADNGISGTENTNGVPQLKPCPFCGGKAELAIYYDFYRFHCPDPECEAHLPDGVVVNGIGNWHPSIPDAKDAWNTRAYYEAELDALPMTEENMREHGWVRERTCRVVKNSRKYVLSDGTELFDDGCSICNGYIGAGENYCSNCGAKVVE